MCWQPAQSIMSGSRPESYTAKVLLWPTKPRRFLRMREYSAIASRFSHFAIGRLLSPLSVPWHLSSISWKWYCNSVIP